jgi:DNA-binding transcriptional regulator YdaS (Cro superfamily)
MPALLDPATTIRNRLVAVGAPSMLLAQLCGISPSHLSNWFRDKVQIGRLDVLRIEEKTKELEELVRICSPLPLDFRQTAAIRDALDFLRDGDMQINVIVNDFAQVRASITRLRLNEGL